MRELSEAAKAAKEIRKKLKQLFPGTKFRVSTRNYAGGDSVNISWSDGPTYDAVMKLGRLYEKGSFDGMTDSYSYNNRDVSIPQTKYVLADRSYSYQMICDAFQICTRKYHVFEKAIGLDCLLPEPYGEPAGFIVRRYLSKMDLTDGVTEKMFEKYDIS